VNYWKVILATVVIFGAGVVTGGLLVNYVNHFRPQGAHRAAVIPTPHPQPTNAAPRLADLPKPRPQELFNDGFIKQLDNVLQLEPEQLDTIKKIIADGQEQNHAIWTNSAAQMRKVMQDARRQIREQLTPEQQKQFEDLLKQFRVPHRPQNSTNAPPAKPAPLVTTNAMAI
jgi:hypothetical protein